jgi:hypothetical protein
MFTRDRILSGEPCFRHENYIAQGMQISTRRVEFAHKITGVTNEGYPIRGDTAGDILGAGLWKANYNRPTNGWSHAWPCVHMGNQMFLPCRTGGFQPDYRFQPEFANVPPGMTSLVPGAVGIRICATKEDGSQENLFFPSADQNKLLAPNRNGSDFNAGTDVFDMLGPVADPGRKAKLQTAWRIFKPRIPPQNGGSGAVITGAGGGNQAIWGVSVIGIIQNGAIAVINAGQANNANIVNMPFGWVNGPNGGAVFIPGLQPNGMLPNGQQVPVGLINNNGLGLQFQQPNIAPQNTPPSGGQVTIGIGVQNQFSWQAPNIAPQNTPPSGGQVTVGVLNNPPQLQFIPPNIAPQNIPPNGGNVNVGLFNQGNQPQLQFGNGGQGNIGLFNQGNQPQIGFF